MMTAIQSYTRQGIHLLRKTFQNPTVRTYLHILQYLVKGFIISAASLGQHCQPFALGLVCSLDRWGAVLTALGAAIGYRVFWGNAGLQGVIWLAAALPATLLLNRRPTIRMMPFLIPAIAALVIAATGLAFQVQWNDSTPISIYLLRIVLAPAVTYLFLRSEEQPNLHSHWLVQGIWVLALAQILPFPWLCLGCVAAGALCSGGSFFAAALAGLALDFAQITPVPMAAVTCAVYFARLIPGNRKWTTYLSHGFIYLATMALCGQWDLYPLPAFALGGLLGKFIDSSTDPIPKRSETGIAQVRLELVAGVFSQMQMLLLETAPPPIDEAALVSHAAIKACGSCPNRKACKEKEAVSQISANILHKPLLDNHDLGITCRKEGRLISELHRAQEQLRTLRAGRELQKESRCALLQQYQFLAEYLQDLSDALGSRVKSAVPKYKPQIALCANRREGENGDRCQAFAAPDCRHYILLCDGMGTGLGAISEGTQAAALLKKLLASGFPPEYALRTFNSLCALRGMAGAVTIDLVQLQLDTGKAILFKWGAAPSYLLTAAGAEKIGTVTPPPGLSVTDARETVERLSLRRGEILVLCSDGVGGEEALRCSYANTDEAPGELAARILESGALAEGDDATVAVVRLIPGS